MSSNRDDFTKMDKRIMAERVCWRCSFSGCGRNTVGPNSTGDPLLVGRNHLDILMAAANRSGHRGAENIDMLLEFVLP